MSNEYICYHGTCDEIEEFSHDFMGQTTYQNAGGFYFSDDIMIANDYTIESYKRKYEYDYETNECVSDEILTEKAINQAHVYKCKVTMNNPLILDSTDIMHREKRIIQNYGENVLDPQKVMYLINIMQNRKYEKDCEIQDDFFEDFIQYFETEIYNEETEEYEYEEKEPYDGLIINNAIDGIADYSNYNESTVVIALDNSQIEILERISTTDMN